MKILISYIFLHIFLFSKVFMPISGVEKKESAMVADSPFALVQLFTSQGCSSCPSADRLLDQVKTAYNSKNVYVLSYHVDYWNRLGWKDPFSKSDFTTLQQAYGFKFNTRSVYTPQAIVNGLYQFVGSDETKMEKYLSKSLKTKAGNSIEISEADKENGTISFTYTVSGDITDKKLKIALVIDQRETFVKRGENGGRTLLNSNIVVEEIEIDLHKKNHRSQISIPSIVTEDDTLSLIAYTQTNNLSVTGADILKL